MTGTELVGLAGTGADLVPSPSLEQVREYIRASKAENTLRGYQSDWRAFCAWCEGHGLCPLPAGPETVAAYVAECAGRLKVGSIQRRLNAIAEAHKALGLESPTRSALVANTMKGIRRTKGTAPEQKAPTLTDDIRAMVDASDAGLIGARDRALVLLGFAGAFRRSELVGLDVEDCAFGKDGLTVTLRRSKTDQQGAGIAKILCSSEITPSGRSSSAVVDWVCGGLPASVSGELSAGAIATASTANCRRSWSASSMGSMCSGRTGNTLG